MRLNNIIPSIMIMAAPYLMITFLVFVVIESARGIAT